MSKKAHEFTTSALVFNDVRVRGVAVGMWARQPENLDEWEHCLEQVQVGFRWSALTDFFSESRRVRKADSYSNGASLPRRPPEGDSEVSRRAQCQTTVRHSEITKTIASLIFFGS